MSIFNKRKPKSILSLLKNKPEEILSLKYDKIGEEFNQQGQTIYKYKAILNQSEFEIFDKIEVTCWTSDKNFTNQPFNISFTTSSSIIAVEKVKNITNIFASTFGIDSLSQKFWDRYDQEGIDQNSWFGRRWFFDENGNNKGSDLEGPIGYSISFSYDSDDGLILKVDFFDNLLKINK